MFGNNNYQPSPQQEQMSGRQAHSAQINGPKALFDNRMDIEGIGMTTSQVMNRQNNNFMGQNPNNYQNYSSVNPSNQQFLQQGPNQNYRQDNYQQNYQQAPQNQIQNRLQNQQQQFQQQPTSSRQNPVEDKFNQYRSNYQQPDQRPHSANRDQYQPQGMQYGKINQYKVPQKVVIPEDF
jgi:hypothetical protein